MILILLESILIIFESIFISLCQAISVDFLIWHKSIHRTFTILQSYSSVWITLLFLVFLLVAIVSYVIYLNSIFFSFFDSILRFYILQIRVFKLLHFLLSFFPFVTFYLPSVMLYFSIVKMHALINFSNIYWGPTFIMDIILFCF